MRNVVIIKGYGAPHEDRWQVGEVMHARDAGLEVFYPEDVPDFVDGASPTVKDSRQFILDIFERKGLEPDRTIVLAHSLGGNAWLKVLEEQTEMRACLTTLLGTPRDNKTGLNEIDDFFPTTDLDLTEDEKRRILVVGSNNDQVIHEAPSVLGEHLGTAHLTIPGAGHFMPRVLHGRSDELDLGTEWMSVRGLISRIHLSY